MNTPGRILPLNLPPITIIVGGEEAHRDALMKAILNSHPHIAPVCFLQPVSDAIDVLSGATYDHLAPDRDRRSDLEKALYLWTTSHFDPVHLANIAIEEILNNETMGVDVISADCIHPIWWKQLIAKFSAKNVLFVQLPPSVLQFPESSRVVRTPTPVPTEAMTWLRRELDPSGTPSVPSLQEKEADS